MASHAKCDQVLFRIIPALATKFLVVNFQVRPGPAALASPAIAAKHLFPESFVQLGIKPLRGLFEAEFGSRRLLGHFVQKSLPLLARQEFEKP